MSCRKILNLIARTNAARFQPDDGRCKSVGAKPLPRRILRRASRDGNGDVPKARGGVYQTAESEGFSDVTANYVDPAVAPEKSYAVFFFKPSGRRQGVGLWTSSSSSVITPHGMFPSTLATRSAVQLWMRKRKHEWSNGLYNIWRLSPRPFFDASSKQCSEASTFV